MPLPLAVRLYGIPSNVKHETAFEVDLELTYHPDEDYSRLENGRAFTLTMGSKTVGTGVVVSIPFVV